MTDNAKTYPLATSAPLRETPSAYRPRERVLDVGVENATVPELLAILLQSGTRGCNVVAVADKLVREFPTLAALARAGQTALQEERGIGPVNALKLRAALELGGRLVREQQVPGHAIRAPGDVASLLEAEVAHLDQEKFWLLLLDTKNRLKRQPVRVHVGGLDSCPAEPRTIFREAILHAAAAVVLAHNHPSGDPTPSADDLRVTRQLVATGEVVGIRVLDHVVIGRAGNPTGTAFVSLREAGLVSFPA